MMCPRRRCHCAHRRVGGRRQWNTSHICWYDGMIYILYQPQFQNYHWLALICAFVRNVVKSSFVAAHARESHFFLAARAGGSTSTRASEVLHSLVTGARMLYYLAVYGSQVPSEVHQFRCIGKVGSFPGERTVRFIVLAGHVIGVHDVYATVAAHTLRRGSNISSSSSSKRNSRVIDAFTKSHADDANFDHPCDVHLQHRYVAPSSSSSSSYASSVFLHAATSGHRWHLVLRTMLLMLLTNGRVERVTVVAVGPQAAAACSLSSLTLHEIHASQLQGRRPSLLCKISQAPLYYREIPTLEMLHSECQLPQLNRALVTYVNP
jgi:hypothetical protein